MSENGSKRPVDYNIVVIRGDGIGPELVESALSVLEAIQTRLETFNLSIEYHEAGAGLYEAEGINVRPETIQAALSANATMKGPAGLPWVRNLRDGNDSRWC